MTEIPDEVLCVPPSEDRERMEEIADCLLVKALRYEERCWCGHGASCDRPIFGVWLLPDAGVWLLCKTCGEQCTGSPPVPPVVVCDKEG